MGFKVFYLKGIEMARALAPWFTSKAVISVIAGFRWHRKEEGE